MTKPIIPSPADVIGPAQVQLIQTRPSSFSHVNWGVGRYANVFHGLNAQAILAIQRLADGVLGSGLRGNGPQLLAYVQSEFGNPLLDRTKAIGTVTLDRTASILPKLAGVILKGKNLHRVAEPQNIIPILAADYEIAADTSVVAGQNIVNVPIIAIADGADPNTPLGPSYKNLTLTDAPFDPAFLPTGYDVGGGTNGLRDADIVRYARSFSAAQNGPTQDAFLLALLTAGGVRHILIQDPTPTGAIAYIADENWGSSSVWCNAVQQSVVNSDYTGYCARINVVGIPNTPILISITVRLRNPKFLSDTSEIDDAIRVAVKSYFDDRIDFNVYGIQQLRAVVSKAHPRILRCTTAAITDTASNPLTYSSPFYGHLYLANNAITFSYLGPV